MSVRHPARVLLDAPGRGVAPHEPREGFTLPDAGRVGTPPVWLANGEGMALAFCRSVWQLGTMNNMHQENPALYFATLADFIKSAQRELEKAEQAGNGTDLQTLHLSEARLKFAAAIAAIDRVFPSS